MTDTNMTEFKSEGQKLFQEENTETDNSAASSTGEKTDTDQTQSQSGEQSSADALGGQKDGSADDKDAGLADHPRWKEREQHWSNRFNDQEKRHTNEIQQVREEMERRFGQQQQPKQESAGQASTEIPAWFGGDEAQWGEFTKHNETILAQAVERTLKALHDRQDSEQKAVDEATKFFNNEVATIETDKQLNPDGLRVDRNKLLKTAMDNDLVDSKGRWNYRAAFRMMKPSEIFQAKQAQIDGKKQLAGATTSEHSAENKPQQFKTPQDFKGKNWGDI